MLKRLGLIAIGYAAAAIASGIVIAAMFLAPGDFRAFVQEAGPLLTLAATINGTFVTALVPAVASIVIAEWVSIRSKWYYLACGAAAGTLLPAMLIKKFVFPVELFGLAAGILAGFTYWAIAGRRAGGRQ